MRRLNNLHFTYVYLLTYEDFSAFSVHEVAIDHRISHACAHEPMRTKVNHLDFCRFYRAMHFSAKRGIAIACRLSVRPSVCLSVCNVGEL